MRALTTTPLDPWLVRSVPWICAGIVATFLLISALLRYSEGFREFWARHICDFLENHQEREREQARLKDERKNAR